MNDTDTLNTTQIAALPIGKSITSVSRAAKAGKLGKPYVAPGTKFKRYKISAIEKYAGRAFTADEIEAARSAHYYKGPRQREIAAVLVRRLVTAALEDRDQKWREALAGQKLTADFTPPPTVKGK